MPSTVHLCTRVLFQSGVTKDFPHFSQMKFVPRTGAFVVFVKSRARQITLALQVTAIIKSLFNQINPNYMSKYQRDFSSRST